ncbi:hypothetical protein B0J14DRAFT_355936 [Halenospora varia]|nr:hypothetical protein B0J14DRAFT_355936 [Halenospora varia]
MAAPIPDFSLLDHGNVQGDALAVTLAFPILATIATSLRLVSRSFTRTFGVDDWLICIALVLYWAETYTTYQFIKVGYIGYHIWDFPKTYDAPLAAKYVFAAELIYVPILVLIKMSICFFLLRLTGQKTILKRSIWGLLIVTVILGIINLFMVLFQCLPISSNWDKTIPNPKCMNFNAVTVAFAALGVITDGLALIIPAWIVWDLQISMRQKIMLIGVLSFGLITVISGMVRLILLDQFFRHVPADPTHTIVFCISTIEVGLAFVAACAPSLKPLLMQFVPRLFSSAQTRYGNGRSTRNNRAGYELSSRSRNGKTANGNSQARTKIEASGNFDAKVLSNLEKGRGGSKNMEGIVMTKELEVKWVDGEGKSVGDAGASTESLV